MENLNKILIRWSEPDFEDKMSELGQRLGSAARFGRFPGYDSEEALTVMKVLREVALKGDEAVSEYTGKFDGVALRPADFRVRPEEIERALVEIDRGLLKSIRGAIENVRTYQQRIFTGNRTDAGLRYTPIRRVGICVPGAKAPLPSTVIMTAVPARVAGVPQIAIVSPPRHAGSIHPSILAVCGELGIHEIYRIGGAQAVAALAAGTATIDKVDMIAGPGNRYVQTAKKMVAGDYVAIDSIAGPSEVLIIADESADPRWVAADMLSQAEHAADSSAVVLTTSPKLASKILEQLARQLESISRATEAARSLSRYGAVIVLKDLPEAVAIANDMASEHLQIQCGDRSGEIAGMIANAGALFVGPYSPVAAGDYWAGPSHTLPTGRRAKFSSALTANDFIKSISIIEYDKKGIAESAEDIIRLAEAEGLDAHAESVRMRLEGQ